MRIYFFTTLCFLLVITHVSAQQKKFRLPAYRTEKEQQLLLNSAEQHQSFGKGGFVMPSNVRYPGEYEESQAVAIAWSLDYDNDGNVIGIDTYSVYGYVSAQCAK